jgi:hypothetical protein
MLVACSSTAPTTDGYLDAVSAITTKMTADSVAAVQSDVRPTRLQVSAIVGLRADALADLRALEPTDEVRPEHIALVQALSRLVDAGREFLASTEGLDQAAFTAALDGSTDIDAYVAEVHSACVVIEQRSGALGHPVSMGC